jgi:phosphoglycolate phosphatase
MALVLFGSLPFDAELVAFDKDGTLIDFDFMWVRLAETWVKYLTPNPGDIELRQELYRSMGYDPQRQWTDPLSPMAMATTDQCQTILAAVLYRFGLPWPEAQDRARRAMQAGAELPLPSLVRPAGNVAGLVEQLKRAGARVAVVTTDLRDVTVETLHMLGIAHLVDHLVCGDDGLPSKPAPDTLLATFRQLGVEATRTAMVGDTVADLLMAQRAGAGLRVAVLTGAGERAVLSDLADVVLQSVDEIVVPESSGTSTDRV